MNSFIAITCLLALTASVRADGALGGIGGLGGLVYAPGHASADYYAYPRYAFEYAVKDPHTGDNKAQWEKRDGDVVKGAYSLVEPDGSLRVVEYWADDKSGFNAVVKRVGPNLHPATAQVAPIAPIYKAPIPVLESHGPIAPISVGSISKYGGLASAPLISGPLLGGAISSTSVYKAAAPSIIKAPIAPILSEPIAHAPILPAPIYSAPIIKSAPIISAPAPILSGYYGGLGDLGGIGGHGGLVGVGGLGGHGGLGGLGGWDGGLIKAPLAGAGYLDSLGHGVLSKGPILPPLGLGSLDYLGYKH